MRDAIIPVLRDRVLYVQDEKRWYICDRATHVWSPENRNGVQELILQAVATSPAINDPDPNLDIVDKIKANLRGVLSAASEDFDRNPNLLATPDELLDLRNLEERPITPQDMVSRCTAIGVMNHHWLHDVRELVLALCDGDKDLADFLARCAGYTLLGTQPEEKMFCLLGPTRTGKSTLLAGLSGALGTYARAVSPKLFLDKPDPLTRYTLAELATTRLVTTSEPATAQSFDGSLLKQVAGGDTIEARAPGGRSFTYTPQFKVWMACNEMPRIHGDPAALRRIIVIPIERQFDPDPRLKRLVRDEWSPGFLSWALDGLYRYRRDGLTMPDRVKEATAAYAEADDDVSRFIKDECEYGQFRTPSKDLYVRYTAWCFDNGEKVLSQAELGKRLSSASTTIGRARPGGLLHYTGIRLKDRPGVKDRLAEYAD